MNSKFNTIFKLPDNDINFDIDSILLNSKLDTCLDNNAFLNPNFLNPKKKNDLTKNDKNIFGKKTDNISAFDSKNKFFSDTGILKEIFVNNSNILSPNTCTNSFLNKSNKLDFMNYIDNLSSTNDTSQCFKLGIDNLSSTNDTSRCSSPKKFNFHHYQEIKNLSANDQSKSMLVNNEFISNTDIKNNSYLGFANNLTDTGKVYTKKHKLPGPIGTLHLKNLELPKESFLSNDAKEKELILSQIEMNKIHEILSIIENKLDNKLRDLLLETPIDSINKKAREKVLLNGKVVLILAYIEKIELSGMEADIMLKDKSGSINGTMNYDLVNLVIPKLHVGDVILFKQVSVICPTFCYNCYLNLTIKNIVSVYHISQNTNNIDQIDYNTINDILLESVPTKNKLNESVPPKKNDYKLNATFGNINQDHFKELNQEVDVLLDGLSSELLDDF